VLGGLKPNPRLFIIFMILGSINKVRLLGSSNKVRLLFITMGRRVSTKSPAKPKTKRAPDAVKKPTTRSTIIRYASDFTGLDTASSALHAIRGNSHVPMQPPIVTKHIFACEYDRLCEKVIMGGLVPPEIFFDNILIGNRDENLNMALGIYFTSPPCQGISPAGLQLGLADPRTKPLLASLNFITTKKPRSFILENSHALDTWSKFEALKSFIMNKVTAAGYTVKSRVLNSKHYLPHNRPRTYMIGVLSEHVRTGAGATKFPWFPEPPSEKRFELASVVKILPASEFKTLPTQTSYKANVQRALHGAATGVGGINPFVKPMVIDMGASPKFSSAMVNMSPSITRTRAMQLGYWCTTKGGPLDVFELATLQGFSVADVEAWKSLKIPERKILGMIGNAQTKTLVADLVPHVLYHSCLINLNQFKAMKVNAALMHA
jgi:site-specific DNA-cytosine methylase